MNFLSVPAALIATALLALPLPAHGAETWQGTRIASQPKSKGITCSRTGISLTRDGGALRGRLAYNGTSLRGSVDGAGKVSMTGSNGTWSYRFDGTATATSMKGTWKEARSGCAGTWSAARR